MKKQLGRGIRRLGVSVERFGERIEKSWGRKKKKSRNGKWKLGGRNIIKILILLIIINNVVFLAGFNSGFSVKELEMVNVTRVIDGDTFEVGDKKVRLLGVNTPESGDFGYTEAKNFLAEFEGEEVGIECGEEDQYGRELCYAYDGNDLINEELVKLGLAHLYYYDEDDKTSKLRKGEEKARKAEIGIWKKSSNYGCVEIVELKYEEEERCTNDEQLVLFNSCEHFQAVLKDDATHIYDVEIGDVFSMNFSCIWNNDGDSVYLWDDEGLVLFYRY